MPEAAAPTTDRPAPSTPAHHGTAAGRQPEAAAPATEKPAAAQSGDAGQSTGPDDLAARVRAAADDLAPLVAQAEAVRAERARAHGAPRWTDVFTTQFTEFSNRPR